MHAIAAFLAGVLLAAACNSKPQGSGTPAPSRPDDTGSSKMTPPPPDPPPTTPPKSALEQVQRWAPAGHTVGAAGVDVPGLDIFMVSPPDAPVPANGMRPYSIVAVAGGVGGKLIEREEVIRAAGAATQDPVKLARLAMLVLRKQGELLMGATTDDQRKAKVTAPQAIPGGIEFWIWTSGVGRMLEHYRLDLARAALEYVSPAPPSANDAVANAVTSLAGTSTSMHASALKTLAGLCATDPKAKQALLDALARHSRDDTRAAAADASAACGAAAVEPLIHAMEQDKANIVRWKAAAALGVIGDAKARPALEKAAKSDSPEVSYAAKKALGKLK